MRSALLSLLTAAIPFVASAQAHAATSAKKPRTAAGSKRSLATSTLEAQLQKMQHTKEHEGPPLRFAAAKQDNSIAVLYLHGGGSRTNDGIIERIAPALHAQGLRHEVISVPYYAHADAVDAMIKAAAPRSLILAGHSDGGYEATKLMSRYPSKFRAALLINPSTFVSESQVPTFVVRGSADGGGRGERGPTVETWVAAGGDHSLRYRPNPGGDREKADKSKATASLVNATAKAFKQFLGARGSAR